MRVENRRIILLTTLSVVAILIDILIYLEFAVLFYFDFKLSKESGCCFFYWLEKIGLFQWGWLLVFIFGGMAFLVAICWKLESIVLRVIFIIMSGAALVCALPWFFLACFFELPT